MSGLSPEIASHSSRYLLIDVRSETERYCGVGFVPGSVVLRPWIDLRRAQAELARLSQGKQPVLVCLDGARARAHALALGRDASAPLHHLAGGLQAWMSAGGAMTGRWEQGLIEVGFSSKVRCRLLKSELRAVLSDERVSQWVLARSEEGLDVEEGSLRRFYRQLDGIAVALLELGQSRARIARLMDRTMGRVPAAKVAAEPFADETTSEVCR